MRWGKRIAVIIPAFNEARLIGGTLQTIPRWVDDIIVVDDGSTDATVQVCRDAYRSIHLVQHRDNRGVGAALVTGYREGFSRGNQVVAVMGADGQMDPNDLAAVVQPVAERQADYCKGNRFAHPSCRNEMPALRRFAGQLLGFSTRLLSGLPVQDSQCGFTALDQRAAKRLDLESLWPRYGYPNDLLVRVGRRSLRLQQVAVKAVYRDETSGLRWWHGVIVVPFVLLRAWLTFPPANRPEHEPLAPTRHGSRM